MNKANSKDEEDEPFYMQGAKHGSPSRKKIQEAMDVMFKQNIVSVEWKYILFNHNLNDLFEVYDIIKKYNITLQLSDSYKSSFIPESFFPDIKVQDVEISQMLL